MTCRAHAVVLMLNGSSIWWWGRARARWLASLQGVLCKPARFTSARPFASQRLREDQILTGERKNPTGCSLPNMKYKKLVRNNLDCSVTAHVFHYLSARCFIAWHPVCNSSNISFRPHTHWHTSLFLRPTEFHSAKATSLWHTHTRKAALTDFTCFWSLPTTTDITRGGDRPSFRRENIAQFCCILFTKKLRNLRQRHRKFELWQKRELNSESGPTKGRLWKGENKHFLLHFAASSSRSWRRFKKKHALAQWPIERRKCKMYVRKHCFCVLAFVLWLLTTRALFTH
jgi:hypothetical protein